MDREKTEHIPSDDPEIVEHLENPGAVLAELRRVLAPDGRLLLTRM